jgi:hypothetical protein
LTLTRPGEKTGQHSSDGLGLAIQVDKLSPVENAKVPTQHKVIA